MMTSYFYAAPGSGLQSLPLFREAGIFYRIHTQDWRKSFPGELLKHFDAQELEG